MPPSRRSTATPRQKILIVEDERIVAMNLQLKLERLGYDVLDLATSGESAIRIAEEMRPDLVLMDVNLEGAMDGVDAALAIRTQRSVPIVFLSAYSTSDIVERATLTEPFGYLLKPFVERELEIAIQMALYRHHLERQLVEQKQLLAATLHSIGDAVVATDAGGLITFMNPAAERLTQWSLADARGRALEEVFVVVQELTRREVVTPLRRAMAERIVVPLAGHFAIQARDRSLIPVEDSAAPILNDRGELLGGVLVLQDATGKREAVRVASSLSAIVSSSQDAIVGFTAMGVITSWNPAAQRLFGYSADEAVGQSILLLVAADGKPAKEAILNRLSCGEEVPPYEAVRRRKDGSQVSVSVALSAVRDTDEQTVGYAAIVRDITQLRVLEDQLRQAQKMEAVGRLAGGLAHDFNNLLTVINGYSDLLLEQLPANSSLRGALQEIREAGEKAATLTYQLLAFSRRHTLKPIVLDLNEVVGHSMKILRRLISEDIVLTTDLDPRLRLVKADPVQLEQAVLNLAINARDAMPRGGRLTITTTNIEAAEGARHRVRLVVTDSGCGMTDAVRAQIFEPFFTTKELGYGTGLGLAMVYGFLQQNAGQIDVESTVGTGTTFTIVLPAEVEDVMTPAVTAQQLFPPAKDGEVVLLAEDDPSVRRIAKVALEMQGYVVLAAEDGAGALALEEQYGGTVDILVTDVVMPKMGGRQLAEAMRQRRPGLKVLFVSGYLHDDNVRRSVSDGTENFIQKPFSPLQLSNKVRTVLDADE